MTNENEFEKGIKSIKSAYRREHTARDNLAKMLESVESENAKLREAVEKASEIIVESCGECPISRYEWLSWDRCAEECKVGKEPECWAKYLTGELGVEVY